MNQEKEKRNILESIPTEKLSFWHRKSSTVGGYYTYFDAKNRRTLTFYESEILKELNSRDDRPVEEPKRKKKR